MNTLPKGFIKKWANSKKFRESVRQWIKDNKKKPEEFSPVLKDEQK